MLAIKKEVNEMMNRIKGDWRLYVIGIAAVLVGIGISLWDIRTETADAETAKNILPPFDAQCSLALDAADMHRQLRHEHGWRGVPHPDEVKDIAEYYNPTHLVPRMFWPGRTIQARPNTHQEIHDNEVAEIRRHWVVVDAWHGVSLRQTAADSHPWSGLGYKYIIHWWENERKPPCFYLPGAGLAAPTPTPEPSAGGQATSTDEG